MDKTLKQSLQIFATKARMGVLEGYITPKPGVRAARFRFATC